MSGGSFGYAYSKIDEIERWPSVLEEMAQKCRAWASSSRADHKWDGKEHVPTTLEDRAHILVRALLLEKAASHLRSATAEVNTITDIMHDVEWVESCDYSLDDLMKPLPVPT